MTKEIKDPKKEFNAEITAAINTVKKQKEDKGIIPKNNKTIVMIDGQKDYKGKTLKRQKCVYVNNQNYSYPIDTKWEDIDIFGRKNIKFSDKDFN